MVTVLVRFLQELVEILRLGGFENPSVRRVNRPSIPWRILTAIRLGELPEKSDEPLGKWVARSVNSAR